MDGRPGFPRV